MYQKYKDKKPEDTIFEIQSILHLTGISATYQFVENDIQNLYSNRVTIDGTTLGTNGKGTTKLYALASGYAELMERLQNNMLYIGLHDPRLYEEMGFWAAADEKALSVEECVSEENSLLEYVFSENQCRSILDRIMLINQWYDSWDGEIIGVPFYNCIKDRVEYLPHRIYSVMYGSNGMCAGNTPWEALVQGMAEIYERYVMKYMLTHEVTPPDVPEAYLRQYPEVYEIISEIREKGKYRILVKDLSLGLGYPVVGTIILDGQSRKFGFRLASHPSFAVALERTLTEAMQGKPLSNFVRTAQIGSEQEAGAADNIANIFKCGKGYYRKELFYIEEDYSFTPFREVGHLSNQEILKSMIEPLIHCDYDILIRDAGYLGFPAYHIIIPGFSEMYPCTGVRIREVSTLNKIAKKATGLGTLDAEDAKRIIRYIRFTRNAIGSHNFSWLFKRPFSNSFYGGGYEDFVLLAAAYYFLEDMENACEVLEGVARDMQTYLDSLFPEMEATAQYVGLLAQGEDRSRAEEVLQALFGEEQAHRVTALWGNPEKIFQKLYPALNCWDCEHCQLRKDKFCCYPEAARIYRLLAKVQRQNVRQQEKVKELFYESAI